MYHLMFHQMRLSVVVVALGTFPNQTTLLTFSLLVSEDFWVLLISPSDRSNFFNTLEGAKSGPRMRHKQLRIKNPQGC